MGENPGRQPEGRYGSPTGSGFDSHGDLSSDSTMPVKLPHVFSFALIPGANKLSREAGKCGLGLLPDRRVGCVTAVSGTSSVSWTACY